MDIEKLDYHHYLPIFFDGPGFGDDFFQPPYGRGEGAGFFRREWGMVKLEHVEERRGTC